MTTPLYDPKVPELPNDSLAESQPEFLANFQALYNAFIANHVPLDTATIGGNHTIVELLEQEEALQTNVSEISVYTKDVPDQTDQIFLRYQGNGQEFQFTNYQLYTLISNPKLQQYFTFLPGKILVYYGKFVPDKPTDNSYTLRLQPTIAKNIITVSLCPIDIISDHNKDLFSYKPNITIAEKNQNGFLHAINVFGSAFNLPSRVFSNYYIILANI